MADLYQVVQVPSFLWSWPARFCYAKVVRMLVLGGEEGEGRDATEWNLDEVYTAVTQFTELRSLSIDRTAIPAYSFTDIIEALPRLEHFHTRSSEKGLDPYSFTPSRWPWNNPIPHAPNLTTIKLYEISVDERFGCPDDGVILLSALSCLPSLTTLRVDILSWQSLCNGRNYDYKLHLPGSLRVLVILPRLGDPLIAPHSDLDPDELLVALQICAASLEFLHIIVPYVDRPRSPTAPILRLNSLKEYIGPEGFLRHLDFPMEVEVVWVSCRSRLVGIDPSVTGDLLSFSRLRFLSVGAWDLKRHTFHSLLTQLPHLRELSITPLASLDKDDLLKMTPVLSACKDLRAISLVCPLALPSDDYLAVLKAWSSQAPGLQSVRFESENTWHRSLSSDNQDANGGWSSWAVRTRLFLPDYYVLLHMEVSPFFAPYISAQIA
ncbi:hypothetical protein AAF712_012917 [Marasmius tenuissimus]|uniref:F-box domain-containing protein n=1 Tax=Marasmius tenuissimus TaxID=585030 RepID=A0ABR2ZH49_9AGAR